MGRHCLAGESTGEGHAEETPSEGRRQGKGSVLCDGGIHSIKYTECERERSEDAVRQM